MAGDGSAALGVVEIAGTLVKRPIETDAVSGPGKRRLVILAIGAAQLLLALTAAPAWAVDSCGGCGTRTAAWVGPVIIVVVVTFLAVLVGVARHRSRSNQGAQEAGPKDPLDHS